MAGRVLSVFGPFNSRVLVEMSADDAAAMFPDMDLGSLGRSEVLEAVERDLAGIRERDPKVASSATAAAAMQMAIELEHPYNSATSKSMCAKALMEAMRELRDLVPPVEKKGELHAIKDARAARLADGGSGGAA